MPLIKPKTISRLAAVQSIYCYFATKLDINQVIINVKAFYNEEKLRQDSDVFGLKLNKEYFNTLTLTTAENIAHIDSLIEANLSANWSASKLHLTLFSILRVGACELFYFTDTPFKVVISEFSDIAGNMLMDNEVGFVNSLLQKIHEQNKEPIQVDHHQIS
jgi:N utilization substance protein B